MWQSLANFAAAELEADEEAARHSYEKLAAATLELQKHVKELLYEYPGAVAEEPGILDPVEASEFREGDTVAQAARLLASLCAQLARGDLMSAPGAIYTPKGDSQLRAPTDAGPSVFVGANALGAFLSADVPSLRWDSALGPAPVTEANRLRQLGPAPLGPGTSAGHRPTAKLLLRVRLDAPIEAEGSSSAQQTQLEALRSWATAALRELHPDTSLEALHAALLRDALQYGAPPASSDEVPVAAWYKLYGSADVLARSRQPLLALFHTSSSSQEAWAAVTQAFAHGLMQPDTEGARMLQGPLRGVIEAGSSSGSASEVTPESYQSCIRDLHDKMDRILGELLQEGLEDGGSPRAGPSLSEKDVAAFRLAVTPRTYLQVVGQKLLHHACMQIPCMAELPERVPDWTLRSLYGKPFAEAIRMALQHGVEAVNDALGPSGEESPDERIRGGRLAQSLLRVSNTRKGEPNKSEPRRQQQQKERERGDAAKQRYSFIRANDGLRATDDMSAFKHGEGKRDSCQRPLAHARSAVELLSDVERDAREFMEGLTAILEGHARGPLRPGRLPQEREKEEPGRAMPLPPQLATAHRSAVGEELSRAFRDSIPTLRPFLYCSITSAVQACLTGDDLHRPPCPVPVSPDVWPAVEDEERQPRDRGSATVGAARDGAGLTRLSAGSSSGSGSSGTLGSARGAADAGTAAAVGRGGVMRAVVRSSSRDKGILRGCEAMTWAADRNVPPQIDAVSHRVLEFVSWLHGRTNELPESVQPVLASAAIECLALLMDRLSLVCTCLGDMPGGGGAPLALALLFHSAACGVRRRLEAMTPWLGAPARQRDGTDVDLVRQHGEALVQADELVTSIHQHVVLAYMQVTYDVVLSCLDRTDWCTFRPEVARGKSAGPAVRVWHSMTLRMLRMAVRHASPHAAEWIVGQVLLESIGCLAHRYIRQCPRVQMLPEYVADVVHLAASVFLFCQPISVRQPAPRLRGAGRTVGDGLEPPRRDSATEGAEARVFWIRLPFPTAKSLSATMRGLLTRAALLYVSGHELEAAARKSGLLASTEGGTAVVSKQPARGATTATNESGNSTGGIYANVFSGGGGGGGTRLAPLPARCAARLAAPAPAGTSDGATGPGVRLAGPVSEGLSPHVPDPSALADVDGGSSGASHDPWVSQATGGGATATDEERLGLWTSWLPSDVVRFLTCAGEVIELYGSCNGGGGGVAQIHPHALIPLRDRMADDAQAAEGRMWRGCLQQLAQRASEEEVLLALARRCELHAAVGTEPPGDAENREIVRGLARRLGLLVGGQEGE